ncbi:ABC transporter permease [Spirilliplanes yamanashiensis]|uniref:ABC transporter n=1 Tax=Spirilliplanes yamanashiensis TaxID=42233 RepID=A0A8J3Y9B9_9ACTN|nr:ABC transporter permease [Spirilliplanes yamanashiensis]MDP9815340.1 ABC-2 type transport system permease protein [Spirilliplanes yamanashiensis]GIJ03595.1 ABC transporter [Spirilliplanes yamanashiensis]
MSLTLTHARFHLLEAVRIPVALIGSAFFPAASMLFFVVPFTRDDAVGATYATASMLTFTVMTTNLFQYGIGVATDRDQPWSPYLRTLPSGPLPSFAGRIVAGLAMMLLSLIPVLVVAALLTPATVSPGGLVAGLGALVLAAVPFTLMGLAIGYALPAKAAIVAAQVLFLPLAFGGGLFTGGPGNEPGFVATVAPYLPTRGAAELMWAAVTDFPLNGTSMAALIVWTVALLGAAVWAYRRDEGRRFS